MLNKKYPASILVVSVMILGIVLATALSISAVSVKERNASIGSSQSIKSYQTADSGIEQVMTLIKDHNGEPTISNIDTDADCDDGEFNSSEGYVVQLKDSTGNIITSCATPVASIASIKSIGTFGNTQRAVEVTVTAVATVDPCAGVTTPIVHNGISYGVVAAEDGRCWLDRNLGATSGAVSIAAVPVVSAYNDATGYGWYFQWGRGADDHQVSTSATSVAFSSTDDVTDAADIGGVANDGKFIIVPSSPGPQDWRSPQNNNLWQGSDGGTTNPCPSGFRLPTSGIGGVFGGIGGEWDKFLTAAGIKACSANCRESAFNTLLKLTAPGTRAGSSSSVVFNGVTGYYWSSTTWTTNGISLTFNDTNFFQIFNQSGRSYGMSVRCIRD
jgi:uncharacterized protein (TIGR02145 family)